MQITPEELLELMEARVAAFKDLYDRGAFLVTAKDDKTPLDKVIKPHWEKDENGRPIVGEDGRVKMLPDKMWRSNWHDLEHHIRRSGYVLLYGCGHLGLLILDFDPMVGDWLAAVSDRLGNEPMAVYQSSGNIKPATQLKPSGIGGHAVWKTDPANVNMTREFSVTDGGFSVGQIFSGHKGYGVIIYQPEVLIDVLDADECEIVDPNLVPKAGAGTYAHQRWGSNWRPDENSRHNSTMSTLAGIVNKSYDIDDFLVALDIIETTFKESIGSDRDAESEWKRMDKKAWEWWNTRQQERAEGQAITADFMKDVVDKQAPELNRPHEKITQAPETDPLRLKVFKDMVRNVIGTHHDSFKDAEEFARKFGAMLLPDLGHNTPSFEKGMKNIGVEGRFTLPDEIYQVRVPGIERFNDWVDFTKQECGQARYVYQYGIKRAMCGIKKKKIEGEWKYEIVQVPDSWWHGTTEVFNEFENMRGGDMVPEVNLIEEMMVGVLEHVNAMSEEEQTRHINMASTWLSTLDHLAVEESDIPSANAFSRYTSVMLAMRLLQHVSSFKKMFGVRPQRHIPVIAGGPGCGKSAAMKALLPTDGEWKILEGRCVNSSFKKDPLHMNRDCHGRVMNIYDELSGIYEAGIDSIKDFIASTTPVYDMKYMNAQARDRTSFLVGTLNNITMPKDDAFRERLFIVHVKRRNPDLEDSVQGRLVHDEIVSKQLSIMYGGILLAQQIRQQIIDQVSPLDEKFIVFEPPRQLLHEQNRVRRMVDTTDDPWKDDIENLVYWYHPDIKPQSFGDRSALAGNVFIKQKDAAIAVGLCKRSLQHSTLDEAWNEIKYKDRRSLTRISKLFKLFGWDRKSSVKLPDGSRDTIYFTNEIENCKEAGEYQEEMEKSKKDAVLDTVPDTVPDTVLDDDEFYH